MARFSPLGHFRTAKPGRRESNPTASDYNAVKPVVVELWPPSGLPRVLDSEGHLLQEAVSGIH